MIDFIVPSPESIDILLMGESIDFFIFFKKEDTAQAKTKAVLTMFDHTLLKNREYEIEIDFANSIKNESIVKLGLHKMIKILENKEKNKDLKQANLDIFLVQKADIQSEVLRLSLKYEILCKKTAFICVIKEKDDVSDLLTKEKILIPNIQSIDYEVKPQKPITHQLYGQIGRSNLKGAVFKSCRISTPMSYSFNSHRMDASPPKEGSLKIEEKKKKKSQESLDLLASISSLESTSMNSNTQAFSINSNQDSFNPFTSTKAQSMLSHTPVMLSQPPVQQLQSQSSSMFSRAPLLSKAKPSAKTFSDNSLIDIVKAQKISGYWSLNENSANLVQLGVSEIEKSIPEAIKLSTNSHDIWITILILALLDIYYESKKGSWTMVQKKAVKWLEENGFDYKSYIDEAGKLL